MAAASHPDSWYLSLLGIAESFRTSNPPNIKLCIHCLQSIFNFKPPPKIEARTHLQLGGILVSHTKNLDLSQTHLENAWKISQAIPGFDDVKYETSSLLAQIYIKKNNLSEAKSLLRQSIEVSQQSPYWRCRLLFQLAQIHANEKDFMSACGLLSIGADFSSRVGAQYTKVLFLLSRGMLLLITKDLTEVHKILTECGGLIEQYQGYPLTQKDTLKAFFLILQVCHFLMAGQVKSVKGALKQLQQSIQALTSIHTDDEPLPSNSADNFQWLPKEHLCVLVYLVTVMHSMQAGYMDKAQKYTDKALMQIEKLKMLDSNPLLSTFQLMLLENIIMCRLIMGNKTMAIHEIFQACHVCQQPSKLFQAHGAQIHTLIGLYAMSMNCMEAAESQFNTSLRLTNELQLILFNNLNLAIVYLRQNKQAELLGLMDKIDPDTVPGSSHSLKASAYYVKGLQSFFQSRYSDSKRYLRETLRMANAEDLNRLTSCSLVLLGHIFLSLGNSEEAMNMVNPAMQLASKIPDVHVQLWASALLKDLYQLIADPVREDEHFRIHESFAQSLLQGHIKSSQQSEHGLIDWTDGPCPFHLFNSRKATSNGDTQNNMDSNMLMNSTSNTLSHVGSPDTLHQSNLPPVSQQTHHMNLSTHHSQTNMIQQPDMTPLTHHTNSLPGNMGAMAAHHSGLQHHGVQSPHITGMNQYVGSPGYMHPHHAPMATPEPFNSRGPNMMAPFANSNHPYMPGTGSAFLPPGHNRGTYL